MLFDYKCKECGEVMELSKRMNDPHPVNCPKCNKDGLEVAHLKAPSVEYKGGNWFKTTGSY